MFKLIKKHKETIIKIGLALLGALVLYLFSSWLNSQDAKRAPSSYTKTAPQTRQPTENNFIPKTTKVKSTDPKEGGTIEGAYLKFEYEKDVSTEEFTVRSNPKLSLVYEVRKDTPTVLWVIPEGMWAEGVNYQVTVSSPKTETIKINFMYKTPEAYIGGGGDGTPGTN